MEINGYEKFIELRNSVMEKLSKEDMFDGTFEIIFSVYDEDDSKNWNYYQTKDFDIDIKLLPAHNDFGYAFNKKAFVIWMHY